MVKNEGQPGLKSMTGFAAEAGEITLDGGVLSFQMDLRAVNGRGLEVRLRLPEGFDALEAVWRGRIAAQVARGNVTLNLRLSRPEGAGGLRLDRAALDAALAMIAQVRARAEAQGLVMAAPAPEGVLGLRGVLESGPERPDAARLAPALAPRLEALLAAFDAARRAEGAALAAILGGQVDQIAALVAQARSLLPERAAQQIEAIRAALARLGEAGANADPARLQQELALLAVKSDITEELDRLDAHIGAARGLLGGDGPVGRRFDFLTQEFNREANTLCAKAQSPALTRIGLDLKTVIDQMREQVQNVE
jgi:uncharacterized protein (TIGR00255 family)